MPKSMVRLFSFAARANVSPLPFESIVRSVPTSGVVNVVPDGGSIVTA